MYHWFYFLLPLLYGYGGNMTDKNSQTEANKRWQEKNKEHSKYLKYRSTARSFIRKLATKDDLNELKKLISGREKDI